MKTPNSTVVARSLYSVNQYKKSCVLLSAVIYAGLVTSVSAQTLIKAANNDSLLTATSWTPNTVPTSLNTLEFNSTWTGATVLLGGNLNILGVTYKDVANGSGRINTTAGQTLSVGSGGIDLEGAGGSLRIDPAIVLTDNQEWAIGSGRILNLVASGISGGYTARVTGAGVLAFDSSGTGTYGSQLEVDVSTLRINFSGSDVTFTNANNSFAALTIFSGTGRFASIANSGSDSAAGQFTTGQLGGNNTNGVFVYTGNTATTNRGFNMDRRSVASGILVSTPGQELTISGNIQHTAGGAAIVNNAFRVGGDGNLILAGVISDNPDATFTGLVKEGLGRLTLGGANTFLGGLVINAGEVTISASERIDNINKLTLNGGNFNVATFSETLGALDLNGSGGTLTLDSGGALVFSDSSAESWSGALTITGSFISGSSIRFGTSGSGLNNGQLSSITIVGYTDIGLNSSGFLTAAIPEPSSFAGLVGFAGLGVAVLRRRRRV